MTRLVHGHEGLDAAQRITQSLFSGDPSSLGETDFEQLKQDGLLFNQVDRDQLDAMPLTQRLADSGMANGKQVKDALSREAVLINGAVASVSDNTSPSKLFAKEFAFFGRFYLLRLGKKKYQLFEITDK